MTVGVPALTQKLRRAACVHEAGHAVIAALGRLSVDRVTVAPLGTPLPDPWEWWFRQSRRPSLGECDGPEAKVEQFIRWNYDVGGFEVDRKGFAAEPGQLCPADGAMRRKLAAGMRQHARSLLCCALAGPLASAIFTGEADAADILAHADGCMEFDDYGRACAIASVLPYRAELDHAVEVAERALRRPDIWGRVMRLADELERVGDITDLDGFLPDQEPGWPSSPGSAEGRRSEWRSRRKAEEARWRASRSGS
jgi:hypothetical protein